MIDADRLDYQSSGDTVVAVFKKKAAGPEFRIVGIAAISAPMIIVECSADVRPELKRS
jgi:hypothetical protein